MPGLVPGISLSQTRRTLGERVDGRDKPGHDVLGFPAMHTNFSIRTLAELALRRQPQQLTHDLGTSRLAQATAAHSALVEVERLDGPAPEVEVHAPPAVAEG